NIFTSNEQFNHWIERSQADLLSLMANTKDGRFLMQEFRGTTRLSVETESLRLWKLYGLRLELHAMYYYFWQNISHQDLIRSVMLIRERSCMKCEAEKWWRQKKFRLKNITAQ